MGFHEQNLYVLAIYRILHGLV